jgi:predicted DNA-binding protein (MmcQ/YjbR family)
MALGPARRSLIEPERRARVVALVGSLPEAIAKECGGQHLSLEIRGKRFGYYLNDHHGDGRLALNCKAGPGRSHELATAHPERFHLPAYLARHGWAGLWLDLPETDWEEVKTLLVEAYRLAAPAWLAARLDASVKPVKAAKTR